MFFTKESALFQLLIVGFVRFCLAATGTTHLPAAPPAIYTPTTNTTFRPSVPDRRDGSRHRHYKLIHEKKSWVGALNYCKDLQMDLATISFRDEEERINVLLRDSGILKKHKMNFWIGGENSNDDGKPQGTCPTYAYDPYRSRSGAKFFKANQRCRISRYFICQYF